MTWLDTFNIWTIPATLAVLAVIQMVYLTFLTATKRGSKREPRQPASPIMPTKPDGLMDTSAAGMGRGSPEAAFKGRMIVLGGLPRVAEIAMPSMQFGIGRFESKENNILVSIDERSISRRHAFFTAMDGEYFLTDTHSSYGTSIRKESQFEPLIPGREEQVYNGDVVQFGLSVTVRLVLPGDTRAASTRV